MEEDGDDGGGDDVGSGQVRERDGWMDDASRASSAQVVRKCGQLDTWCIVPGHLRVGWVLVPLFGGAGTTPT